MFTEFIIGYMLPGRPLAMMCFKTLGYITMYQGLLYTQDLKMAHYMKIPPRVLFWAQGIGTVWGSLVQVAVLDWAFGAIKNICATDQSARFSCPNGRVFFNASIIWGAIGRKYILHLPTSTRGGNGSSDPRLPLKTMLTHDHSQAHVF